MTLPDSLLRCGVLVGVVDETGEPGIDVMCW